MDRSHLVLGAAAVCAVLAAFQVFRQSEAPEPAPAAPPAAAAPAPAPDVAAAPAVVAVPLRVQGEVASAGGEGIPGVRVVGVGGASAESITDATGAYEILLERKATDLLSLRFTASGYEDREARLDPAHIAGGEARLDVQLAPKPGAVVSGIVTTERGAPLAGELIQLGSAAAGSRYVGVTDASGRFALPGIAPRPDYYLSVQPRSDYGDFQRAIAVGAEGLSLEIALRPLATARLAGRIVDPDGEPIPELAFSVVSGQALGRVLPARTDGRGYFVVDGVPTGYVFLRASAPETLTLGSVLLRPGGGADVLVRADWGEQDFAGRVVGAGGRPLAGAEVELSWSHVGDGVSGRSSRLAVTRSDGSFRFERIGSGLRRLEVRAAGHREVQLDTEISPDSRRVEVQLEAAREAG